MIVIGPRVIADLGYYELDEEAICSKSQSGEWENLICYSS